MTFIYFYIFYIFYTCIYNSLIYSRAILSFAWLTGYATRPVVLSYTVHTDSFTAHNNYPGGPLALAVFSGSLKIKNKITKIKIT